MNKCGSCKGEALDHHRDASQVDLIDWFSLLTTFSGREVNKFHRLMKKNRGQVYRRPASFYRYFTIKLRAGIEPDSRFGFENRRLSVHEKVCMNKSLKFRFLACYCYTKASYE